MKKISTIPKFFLFIAYCLLSTFSASAQDTIYKRNKEIIQAKIIEIGLDEIKYKMPNYVDGPTIVIAKDQIWKIIFASGVIQLMTPEMFNPENYSTQNEGTEQKGAFVRFGYKFIKSPDYYLRGMKYAHILKGSYIRPEILFGSYSESYSYQEYNYYGYPSNTTTTINDRITYGAFQLSFGKQFIFNDLFLVDYYLGVGKRFFNRRNKSLNFWSFNCRRIKSIIL